MNFNELQSFSCLHCQHVNICQHCWSRSKSIEFHRYHSLFVLYILCDHPWSTNCMLDAILTALATLATRLHLHPLVGLQFVQVLCFGFLCPHVLSSLKWPKLFAFVLTRYSDAHCWTTSSSQMQNRMLELMCIMYIYNIYNVISINPSVCSCCWCITPCEVKTEKW